MQRLWSTDELGERWSLLPEDLALLAGRVDAGKLGFAVQLAFWRQHGRLEGGRLNRADFLQKAHFVKNWLSCAQDQQGIPGYAGEAAQEAKCKE